MCIRDRSSISSPVRRRSDRPASRVVPSHPWAATTPTHGASPRSHERRGEYEAGFTRNRAFYSRGLTPGSGEVPRQAAPARRSRQTRDVRIDARPLGSLAECPHAPRPRRRRMPCVPPRRFAAAPEGSPRREPWARRAPAPCRHGRPLNGRGEPVGSPRDAACYVLLGR